MSRRRGPTILAIETDEQSRETLSRALWLSGCACLIFDSWDEAEQYFRTEEPGDLESISCILSAPPPFADKNRPLLSCLLKSAPVIRLGSPEDDAACFLKKPFEDQELIDVVSRHVDEDLGKARFHLEKDGDEGFWLEVEVPTAQFYLDRFQQYCSRLIDKYNVASSMDEFKIAVQELGQNAIEWGHGFRENMRLRLAYSLRGDRILVRITDQGEGFDHSNLPDTSDPIALIESREQSGKRPGGFGVQLSRKVMDSITYNAKGNVVTLEKQFTSPKQ